MKDYTTEQRIPVVWGVDKNYVLQAFVVMRSILLNSQARYQFILLTIDSIDEEVEKLTVILKGEYNNFEVSVMDIDSARLEGAVIHNKHLSMATYFRLLIVEMLREYDKCIYLDCDVIVHGDLKELYEIELEDNYLAGVKDCHIIEDTPYEIDHQCSIGLPTRDRYINAGVLVMGLRKMRQDEIIFRFMEQLKRENRYEDQDILNVCCYPFIKTIPLKYNLFHFYLGEGIKCLYSLSYDKQDFAFDHEAPYILHMGGIYKAWVDFDVKGACEWWEIAKVFSASESYQFYWQKCENNCMHDKLLYMISRAKESKCIVIWGYSKNGKRLCDTLLEYQLEGEIFFVDNNEVFLGQNYRGKPVIEFSYANRELTDVLWIVSCQISHGEVIRQLIDNGVNEKNIIRYEEPYMDYLYLLSRYESAYDNMVAGIARREYVCRFPDINMREKYIKDIMNNPLQHDKEYTYLAEKYNFSYWFELWHKERAGNEDNSYYGMPK